MTTLTRRRALQTAAVATTALSMPFVRGAQAAGSLSVAFWDHWVPGANEPLRKLCQDWADKEKVAISIDFVTSNGDKDLLTLAAEAQAKSGHDIMEVQTWYAAAHEPRLGAGRRHRRCADQGARRGPRRHRISSASRTATGSRFRRGRSTIAAVLRPHRHAEGTCRSRRHQDVPGRRAGRQGIVRQMDVGLFPDGRREVPQGRPSVRPADRPCSDAVNWVGAVFAAYGAELVDPKATSR